MKSRNSVLTIGSRFFGLAVAFVMTPIYIGWSGGKDAYGVLLFAFNLSSFVNFIDLGYMVGAQKYMVEALVDGEEEEAHRIQRVQATMTMLTAFVGFWVFVVFGLLVPFPVVSRTAALWIFVFGGVNFASSLMVQVVTTVALSYDQVHRTALATVLKDMFQLGVLVYFGLRFHNVVAMAGGSAMGSVAALVIAYGLLKFGKTQITFRPLWDWPLIQKITRIGIRNVPNNIIGSLSNRGDRLLIGGFVKNTGVLTDYLNSCRLPELSFSILSSVNTLLTPEMIRALRKGDENAARVLTKNGLIVWSLGCAFILVPAGAGDTFLRVWLKQNAPAQGGLIMTLMAFYFLAELHHLTLGTLFASKGVQHKLIMFAVYNAVVTVALTLPMYYRFGLVGVAAMNFGINALQLLPRLYVCARELPNSFNYIAYITRALGILAVSGVGWYGLHLAMPARLVGWSAKLSLLLILPFAVATLAACILSGLAPAPGFLEKWLPESRRQATPPE